MGLGPQDGGKEGENDMPYLFLIIAPKAPIRTGTKPPGEARDMASESAVATVTALFAASYQALEQLFGRNLAARAGFSSLGGERGHGQGWSTSHDATWQSGC